METKTKKGTFATLNALNVNGHTEKKSGLTYLSWPWAWGEVKKAYPEARYEVERFDGKPYLHDPELGYLCFTRVTIGDETNEMWLPVMDSANKAMKAQPYTYQVWNKYKNAFENRTVAAATMFDINKTIMRCLVKNLAMFGLGLYIYAGEDLPEEEAAQPQAPTAPRQAPQPAQDPELEHTYNLAVQELRAATSRETLNAIYTNYKATLGGNQRFIDEMNARAVQLGLTPKKK